MYCASGQEHNTQGFEFVSLGSAVTVTVGDVNGDNTVDVLDAAMVQKYASGKTELTEDQLYSADVNDDNNVDVLDAAEIQKYAAGKITEFKKKNVKSYQIGSLSIVGVNPKKTELE